MGNEVSQTSENQLWYEKEFTQLRAVNDPHYGEAKIIVNNQTHFLFAELTRTINQQSIFEQKLAECTFRKNLSHENLVRLVNYTSTKKDEFCSTFYKITQLYEYCPNDLKREIFERIKNKKCFQEGELLNIIKGVVSVLRFLKEQGLSHHDIRPYTLLISNEGVLKLSENLVYNKQISGYQQLCMDLTQDVYLAPKLITSLKDRDLNPQVDHDKCDIFSLGMTVLEAATLQTVSGVYNLQDYTVSQFALELLLKLVEQSYSLQFSQLLQQLLIIDEQQRPGLDEVYQLTERIIEQLNQKPTQVTAQELPQEPQPQNDYVTEQQTQQQQVTIQLVEEEQQTTTNTITVQQYQPVQIKLESPAKADLSKSFYSNYPAIPPTTGTLNLNADQNYLVDWQIKQQTFIDLDARINQVLQMSKETILRYGGPQAQRLYDNDNAFLNNPVNTYTTTPYIPNYQTYQPYQTYGITSSQYNFNTSYTQSTYQPPATTYYDTYQQCPTDQQQYQKIDQMPSINTQSVRGSQISQKDPSFVQFKVNEANINSMVPQQQEPVQQVVSEYQTQQMTVETETTTQPTQYQVTVTNVQPQSEIPQQDFQQQVEEQIVQPPVEEAEMQQEQDLIQTEETPVEVPVNVDQDQEQPLRQLSDISQKVNQVNQQQDGQEQEKVKRSKNQQIGFDDDLNKQIEKSIAKSREIEELIKSTRKALEQERLQSNTNQILQKVNIEQQENQTNQIQFI